MEKKLYKLINGRLVRAPKRFLRGGELVEVPESSLIRFGYVPIEDVDKPDVPEGYELKTTYEYVREEPKNHLIPERARKCVSIRPIYDVVKIPLTYTYDDYNLALEDYIRSVRVERGYDEREPSACIHSRNPRWKSDAEDWCAFLDAVMFYALPILNEYLATGNAPTLAEFKAGFPKMAWTYQEEA